MQVYKNLNAYLIQCFVGSEMDCICQGRNATEALTYYLDSVNSLRGKFRVKRYSKSATYYAKVTQINVIQEMNKPFKATYKDIKYNPIKESKFKLDYTI